MHKYFIKTPWLVKQFFSSYVWSIDETDNIVYLTFDDGPHPVITPWVLDELKKYNAFATFFCIGNNVQRFPEVYKRILNEGHAVGNHTFKHLNGWESSTEAYVHDVAEAKTYINSNLFRPPYGKIKTEQAKKISSVLGRDSRIIMWDVLSADFDQAITPEQCFVNLRYYTKGSIIVFHDSEKAFPNLKFALPRFLKELKEREFVCKTLK